MYHTFSGLVSTLKRNKPKQSTRTMINDEHNTRAGFLATQVPYFLKKERKKKRFTSRSLQEKRPNYYISNHNSIGLPIKLW